MQARSRAESIPEQKWAVMFSPPRLRTEDIRVRKKYTLLVDTFVLLACLIS